MSDSIIEVIGSDGQTKQKIKASEYIKSKKLRIQFELVPKIILAYILQLIVSFLHAVILLNASEQKGEAELDQNSRMLNWIVFVLFFYMYCKGA